MKKEIKKACKCKDRGQKVDLPLVIKMDEIKSSLALAENQERVEVIFEYKGQSIRLLGDKDGIHVGSIVNVAEVPQPVKAEFCGCKAKKAR